MEILKNTKSCKIGHIIKLMHPSSSFNDNPWDKSIGKIIGIGDGSISLELIKYNKELKSLIGNPSNEIFPIGGRYGWHYMILPNYEEWDE